MNYYYIIRPLIGATIGYVTNWIAVKMLFRPLNPIKIGKFTMPFTPGIIPKNKERISSAIGDSISQNLLTEETLRSTLLSENKKNEIRNSLITYFNNYCENNHDTLKETLENLISTNTLDTVELSIKENLSENIFNSIKEANLGELISIQIQNAASEKLKGSVLGLFGGNSIVSSLGPEITLKINSYISENGKDIISKMIDKEITKAENSQVSDLLVQMNNNNLNIIDIIMELYEKTILERLSPLLTNLNISQIVSDKINSMPTLELEKLILEIMKKELNALVNLGALIGFVLGLLNLLF